MKRDGTAAVPYDVDSVRSVFLTLLISQPWRPLSRLATAPLEGAPRTRRRAPVRNLCREALPRRASVEPLPRSAAPSRGSPQCAHWGKGSPELSLEQRGKESVILTLLSLLPIGNF